MSAPTCSRKRQPPCPPLATRRKSPRSGISELGMHDGAVLQFGQVRGARRQPRLQRTAELHRRALLAGVHLDQTELSARVHDVVAAEDAAVAQLAELAADQARAVAQLLLHSGRQRGGTGGAAEAVAALDPLVGDARHEHVPLVRHDGQRRRVVHVRHVAGDKVGRLRVGEARRHLVAGARDHALRAAGGMLQGDEEAARPRGQQLRGHGQQLAASVTDAVVGNRDQAVERFVLPRLPVELPGQQRIGPQKPDALHVQQGKLRPALEHPDVEHVLAREDRPDGPPDELALRHVAQELRDGRAKRHRAAHLLREAPGGRVDDGQVWLSVAGEDVGHDGDDVEVRPEPSPQGLPDELVQAVGLEFADVQDVDRVGVQFDTAEDHAAHTGPALATLPALPRDTRVAPEAPATLSPHGRVVKSGGPARQWSQMFSPVWSRPAR